METPQDVDPVETAEWLEALEAVIDAEGVDRAHFLLENLIVKARESGAFLPYNANTPYVNTIPVEQEQRSPGNREIERRIRSIIRWNAVAIILRANKKSSELGGHIGTFQSAATLYDVGFSHFWRAPSDTHGGDLLYIQGHSSPGIYARAFLEGRLTEEQMLNFRREVDGKGLSSYPHPWLMPDFWQFPTVSMGLGPLMAIYQARFMKYLQGRGLAELGDSKVWAFVGDGEMDEPESLGAISLATREHLDNLIFVVNCNLQRLDGPVRGNGKIIQELEADFRGAGWNVIKVIWGSNWDALLARDKTGLLHKRMEECVDGEYQAFKARDGAYVRAEFFGKYPELLKMVSAMTDDEVWQLRRGGHDVVKIYAAYASAIAHRGQPTVILAKTVKGYGMGAAGGGMNITHQQKKMDVAALKKFRDRFNIPVPDEHIAEVPFYRPPEDSVEVQYLKDRRAALGGSLPQRRRKSVALDPSAAVTSRPVSPTAPAPLSPRLTISRRSPIKSARACPGATASSVPTASAVVTIAPACAISSKSIVTMLRSPRSNRSPTRKPSRPPPSPRPSKNTASIPKSRIRQPSESRANSDLCSRPLRSYVKD
jgi:pyruvate dehydrogenase E1 component